MNVPESETGLSQSMGDMDLSVTLPHMEKSFLYEVVENHIIQFREPIQATQMLRGSALHLESTWANWDRLQEVLKGLGFSWLPCVYSIRGLVLVSV